MALLIEGIGEDWVVMRRPGGRPELIMFRTLDEMRRMVARALAKAEQVKAEKPRKPPLVVLPQAAVPPPIPRPRPKYPPLPPDADCRTCGACCAPKDQRKDTHPALEPEDVALIPQFMRRSLVVKDGGQPYIKTKKNADGVTVCAALSGTVGEQCKCGIYAKRPMVCRVFEKGSEECLEARVVFGV